MIIDFWIIKVLYCPIIEVWIIGVLLSDYNSLDNRGSTV